MPNPGTLPFPFGDSVILSNVVKVTFIGLYEQELGLIESLLRTISSNFLCF